MAPPPCPSPAGGGDPSFWVGGERLPLEYVPGASEKIAFDKFHVAKSFGEAVDKARRAEHKALLAEERTELSGSQYQ